MKQVLVGLGNPGEEYVRTRHNAGREALEQFVNLHGGVWRQDHKRMAEVAQCVLGQGARAQEVICLLPNTFMNKSGKAVAAFIKSDKAVQRLVVLHDDIDLPEGMLRIAFNRGSGGHRGVESIARALGTKCFLRVRIGVAKKSAKGKALKPKTEEAVITHILKPLSSAAYEKHEEHLARAAAALTTLVLKGSASAMNEFNR